MSDLNFQQIIALNNSLIAQEKQFHRLSTRYRIVSVLWLFAIWVCIGIAILKIYSIPFSPELFMALVGYSGVLGQLLLWNMDTGLTYRLLASVINEGLKLEHTYPQLPQVRHNMAALHGGRGWQQRVNWFYSIPVLILLAFGTFNLQHYLRLDDWQIWALWIGVLFLYSSFSFYIRNESVMSLRRRIKTD